MTAAVTSRRSRMRLELNASALMLSTVMVGLLGIGFWIVAARLFPPASVGRASAALSAMTFLAGLAQLNIVSVFVRFVPTAGANTAGFIRRGYGLAVLTGLVLSSGFLALGLAQKFLGHGWLVGAAFLGATVLYAIFFVQDGALVALGKAVWVPVENTLFGLARIALLVGLEMLSQRWGALLALTIPIIIAVAVVNWYIFGRLVPGHIRRTGPTTSLGWAEIKGFVAADYVASVVGSCVTLIPPVLVAATLGTEATAYFYVPWFIGVSFGTLLWSVAMSFVSEAAADPTSVPRLVRRAARLVGAVSVTACVGTLLVAPLVLRTLGSTYATEGSSALRIIALAFPFTGLITMYTAMSLLRKTLTALVVVQAMKAAVFLGLSAVLLHRFGINGLVMTYVGCEAAAALIFLPRAVEVYRHLTSSPTDLPVQS